MAYRTKRIPKDVLAGTDIFSETWHCDGKTTDHTKLFVCIHETTAAHGPLHFLSREESKQIVEKRPNFDRYVDGQPGDFVDEVGTR
jgi:hypothetical protein